MGGAQHFVGEAVDDLCGNGELGGYQIARGFGCGLGSKGFADPPTVSDLAGSGVRGMERGLTLSLAASASMSPRTLAVGNCSADDADLLRRLADDPQLQHRDIVVMAPDISAYAPYLALEVADSEDGWILMTARR